MDVRIQAIHFDATAQLEAFIQKKVSKLEQYFDGIILAEVTLKVVKPETVKNKQASIMLSVKNGECFADKINDTFEGAIDDSTAYTCAPKASNVPSTLKLRLVPFLICLA